MLGGDIPVWVTNLGHNDCIVALFNTAGTPVSYTLPWDELGFANAADVRDLWLERDLGRLVGADRKRPVIVCVLVKLRG